MGKKIYYTELQIRTAVETSLNYAETMRKIGWDKPTGGRYAQIKRYIAEFDIDTSHFKSNLEYLVHWKKGNVPTSKIPLEDILTNKVPYDSTHRLKKRLWKEGIFEKICNICKLKEWMGKSIPLQLDHIDGNRNNNLLKNLRIVCPNCHAQTDT